MKQSKAAVLDDAGTTSYLDAEGLSVLELERALISTAPVAGDPMANSEFPAQRPGDPMSDVGKQRDPGKPQTQPCAGDPMSCSGKPREQEPGDPMSNPGKSR